MAKRKTTNNNYTIAYKKELSLLKRRIKSWEKTHRVLYTNIPKRPKNITEKSIEKLRKIRWRTLSEKVKKEARENYEYKYEEKEIPIPEENREPYTPPTEEDFYNDFSNYPIEDWQETPNEPAISKAEIDAFIEDTINTILDTGNIQRVNEDARTTLESLLDQLRHELGDEGFYIYLSDPEIVAELTSSAQTSMATSPPKQGNGAEKQNASDAIQQFAYILNRHRPLDTTQAQRLQEVIQTAGYYNELSFDFED